MVTEGKMSEEITTRPAILVTGSTGYSGLIDQITRRAVILNQIGLKVDREWA
jgi:hypothetical protein